MMTEELTQRQIGYFNGKNLTDRTIGIINEVTFTILLNGDRITSNACTGIHLRILAVGYLRSAALIETMDDIESIEIDEKRYEIKVLTKKSPASFEGNFIGSSGSRGGNPDVVPLNHEKSLKISTKQALALMEELLSSSRLHDATGGTHCSALATPNGIIQSFEDIGRHNTIDMVGGLLLMERMDHRNKILLTTGRISSEIVSKASRFGIPLIISHSAGTSKAVDYGEKGGITIIGYVRKGTMNIYSHGERVVR